MSSEVTKNGESSRLIITVHGIRTFGQWQERLEKLIVSRNASVAVVNYKYGYFSVLAFVVPFLRWIVTRKFRKALVHKCSSKDWDRIDIIAHSFGTHLVGWGLEGTPVNERPSLHTVILAGSVLKPGFPWKDLIGQSVQRLVNECGVRDKVLLLNQLFVLFTGMAGREGFNGMTGNNFRNRYFQVGHGGYFRLSGKDSDAFMEENWLPLLLSNEEIPDIPDPRPGTFWRGITTFLFNNSEPVKLFLWVLPFLFVAIYLQDRRVDAEEARWVAQLRLADSIIALGNADSANGNHGSALNRYLEARTQLATLQTDQQMSNLQAWKKFRRGLLLWRRQNTLTAPILLANPWTAELAIWSLLGNWQPALNTLPIRNTSVSNRSIMGEPAGAISSDSSGGKALIHSEGVPELWNLKSGVRESRLDTCVGDISSLALSADGSVAYLGTSDGELMICPVTGSSEPWRIRAHDGAVTVLAVGHDSGRIVTRGTNATKIWDVNEKELLNTMALSYYAATPIVFSNDGQFLLASFHTGYATVLDSLDLELVQSLPISDYAGISAVFRADDRIVTQGSAGFALWKWAPDGSDPEIVSRISLPNGIDSETLVLSPGGTVARSKLQEPVMVAVNDQVDFETLKIFSLDFKEPSLFSSDPVLAHSWRGLATQSIAADFSDHDEVLITHSYGALSAWDLRPVQKPIEHFIGKMSMYFAQAVPTFSSDGRMIAAIKANSDGRIGIWDTGAGILLATLPALSSTPAVIAWTKNDRLLLIGDDVGTVTLFDLLSNEITHSIDVHDSRIKAIVSLDDGASFVSADESGDFRVWNYQTNTLRLEFGCGGDGREQGTALSFNGQRAAANCQDDEITVWNVHSQAVIAREREYGGPELAFSIDGKQLAFGSGQNDHAIHVVDIDAHSDSIILANAGAFVAGLGFLANDRILVSASTDRQLRFWDLGSHREIRAFTVHHEGGMPLSVSAVGQHVLSNGAYGQFLLWDLSNISATAGMLAERRMFPNRTTSNAGFIGHPLSDGLWYLSRGRCTWAVNVFENLAMKIEDVNRNIQLAKCYLQLGRTGDAQDIFHKELAHRRISETYASLWLDTLETGRPPYD